MIMSGALDAETRRNRMVQNNARRHDDVYRARAYGSLRVTSTHFREKSKSKFFVESQN